jgi:acetyltransferase-like isoleucine patch superfamily enzyme
MRRFLLPYLAWLLGSAYRSRQILRQKSPTLGIDRSVDLKIDGNVVVGRNVVLSKRAKLLVPLGTCLMVGDETYIGRDVELASGTLLQLGQRVSLQDRCVIVGDVVIGSYSLFSLNVLITSGQHYHRYRPYSLIRDQDVEVLSTELGQKAHSRPVRIGEDCWLGVNTVVMPGVCIGRGAVVGANSVVNSDVAPYTVVAGLPAKPIGKRLEFCPPAYISWDKPTDTPYFYAGFDLSNEQREAYKTVGGLVARQSFELWLEYRETPLKLRVKSLNAGLSNLSHGEYQWVIGSEAWSEVEVPYLQSGPMRFDLFGSPIAVSSAWTL